MSQVYAFIAVTCWSTAYVFTKNALESYSTGALGFLRCFIATIVLMAVILLKRAKQPTLRDLPALFLSGAAGFGIFLIAFNIASATLNPTTGCVIIATSPIITALMARFVFGERLSFVRWTGIAIGFIGVLVMFLWNGALSISPGLVWMFLAAVLVSVYNIMQRWLSRDIAPLTITAYSFLFGALQLAWFAPAAAAQTQTAPMAHILLVLFFGVFPSAIGYLSWGKALAITTKTGSVANYMFLTPFLALILDYAVTGDLPGMETFVGGGLILAGLVIFATAKKEVAKKDNANP